MVGIPAHLMKNVSKHVGTSKNKTLKYKYLYRRFINITFKPLAQKHVLFFLKLKS